VHGIWITPAILRSHLLEAGYKPQHVHAMLNLNDKQDVLLAYTLLHDIWSLPQLTSGAPGCINTCESLCLFGSMCYHFLMLYICVDLSIKDQLEYLSYMAHLALVLYAHDMACNNFIPTALYVDLILMVKSIFFYVTKAKIDIPNKTSTLYYFTQITWRTSLAACVPSLGIMLMLIIINLAHI
jgi:hypothetical protein